MIRFTPTPAPADKSLIQAAILISLALHLLFLLLLGPQILPRLPEWTPHALKVTLLASPPATSPPVNNLQLSQYDSQAGQAPRQNDSVAAMPSTPATQPASPRAATTTPSTPVLSQEKADYQLPAPAEPTPPTATDWLAQARQLASTQPPAPAPSGDNQSRAAAIYGVNAKGVSWARYVEDWRLKIERIGKLHYPAEARTQGLFGNLELAVIIRADGQLQDVRLLRSSGHAVLDEAAVNIVRIAAPYPPFPPTLAAEFRSLEVVRKWRFTTSNQLSSN